MNEMMINITIIEHCISMEIQDPSTNILGRR